jgi:alanine-glyoxylate transaminase / (R)-3-amino-2-methylpropionate-pyruvate transaminase
MTDQHIPLSSGKSLPPCPHRPSTYTGPTRDEIVALRREYVNPGLFPYYREPICIVEGHMQYLYDDAGRRYLDAVAGIAVISVGHCHPTVTQRTVEQLNRLVHTTTIYLHPSIAQLARKLADHMPASSDLKVAYFANSGSEANDLATMMALLATHRDHILALQNAYHGGTQATMAMTAIASWKYPVPSPVRVSHGIPGYCYRCPLNLTYPTCDLKCARSLENLIQNEAGGEIACFIAEPIQGVGGVIIPPREYFQVAYEIVHRYGGLCISDEVQAGSARTGYHYWGFEYFGVVPDMVTMAKGIANGAPLSAVVTRPEIAAKMTQRLHFNTFGGNPVSIAQGLAVMEVIEQEGLQDNARVQGEYLLGRLRAMQDRYPLIGEVRGMGLLIGIELVKDRNTREPASTEAAEILELARERGLLLGKSGLQGNVIRLTPPLCITRDDCEFLADCLDECLAIVGQK